MIRQLLNLVNFNEFHHIADTLDKAKLSPFRTVAFASVSRIEAESSQILLQLLQNSHLIMTRQVTNPRTKNRETQPYRLLPKPEIWAATYDNWLTAVRSQWADRININANQALQAEVFSPCTCAVYAVPSPDANPIDENNFEWLETDAVATRGDGMHLIYDPNYKRNPFRLQSDFTTTYSASRYPYLKKEASA